jgi:hypothetical protein
MWQPRFGGAGRHHKACRVDVLNARSNSAENALKIGYVDLCWDPFEGGYE